MADKDTVTKQFVKDKEVFADAFNYFLYDGRKVINPAQLKAVDTTGVIVPYGENGTGIRMQTIQKIRDSFYSVMTEGNKIYMLGGIENQTEPHNAMPVRNALYDIIEDAAQKFDSDLGKALIYIKNMGRPDKIEQLSADERFRMLKTDTVLMLNEIMKADFKVQRKEKVTDMCYAIEKIKEDAAILATIDTFREMDVPETDIKKKIIKKYRISEKDASSFMAGKKA